MTINLKETINEIIDNKIKDHVLAYHFWLKGFSHITGNKDTLLDKYKIYEYSKENRNQFKEFTHLASGSFISQNRELVKQGKLCYAFLPVTNDFHISFFFEKEGDLFFKVFYSSCRDCYRVEPGIFPYVELRHSIQLSKMDNYLTDNRVSMIRADPEVLIASYREFEKLINNTRA